MREIDRNASPAAGTLSCSKVHLPVKRLERNMDAFEDTENALDTLLEWLGRNPRGEPTMIGNIEALVLRQPGEYTQELDRLCRKVLAQFDHLERDGHRIPDDYGWRKALEALNSGCSLGFGVRDPHGEEELTEMVRSIKWAKSELPKLKQHNSKATPARHVASYEPQAVASITETVDHTPERTSWGVKLVFLLALLGLWVWKFPKLYALISGNARGDVVMTGVWIMSTFAVGALLLALMNTIKKP